MSTKNWVVSQLDCLPEGGDLNKFVVVCHWRRQATEVIDGKEYNADVYGAQSFTSENVTEFTPYEDLTFETVCGWLENSLDMESLDANLDTQIANLINPPIISPKLPWMPAPITVPTMTEIPVFEEPTTTLENEETV
jgi:hypothetical protein